MTSANVTVVRRPCPLRPNDPGYLNLMQKIYNEQYCSGYSWTPTMNVDVPIHAMVSLMSTTCPVFSLTRGERTLQDCEYFQNSISILSAFQNNCNVVSTNLVDMSTKETWSYPKVLTELSRNSLAKPTPILSGEPVSDNCGAHHGYRWSSGYFDELSRETSSTHQSPRTEFSAWNSQLKLGHEENKIVFADPLGSFYRSFNRNSQEIQTSRIYRCSFEDCRKKFSRKEELTRHMKTHSEERDFQCEICKRKFGRKDHWKKHLLTHADISKRRRYVCPELSCGKRYTRSDALSRHRNAAHGPCTKRTCTISQ